MTKRNIKNAACFFLGAGSLIATLIILSWPPAMFVAQLSMGISVFISIFVAALIIVFKINRNLLPEQINEAFEKLIACLLADKNAPEPKLLSLDEFLKTLH